MTLITIGELLRRHRLDASLTQQELARLMPFSYTTISRVENDKQRPTEAYLAQFAQALHLPEETHQEIWTVYRSEVESRSLATDSVTLATTPSKPRIYHNLPQPDYGHFIGREAELAQVFRILRPYPDSQMHLVTIDGLGGIGKTALALEVAHRYLRDADQFPVRERFEAIVWTSAKQTVLRAQGSVRRQQVLRNLDDIFAAIAVALEREDITRARSAEQAEVVRNALIQQRTLLIVDNLETVDDEAVINFLLELPAPTKAIVTTRHRIDVAYPVRLVGMPWEEAQPLIALEIEKKGVALRAEEVRRLYERTGGVPLAIVWSIAQMGFGYGVEAVLRRLGQPADDVAQFCFAGSVERIRGRPAHHLLMALALFELDAGREALGYVVNLPEIDRDEGLVTLELLSLVNKRADRFRLSPLTKSFAQAEILDYPDFLATSRQRLVTYLKGLYEVIDSEYYWRNYNYAFLDEGSTIIETFDWVYREGTAQDVITLAFAARDYLEVLGQFNRALEICRRALGRAESAQNSIGIARLANTVGWLLREQGEYQPAEGMFNQALTIYRSLDNREGECITVQHLAGIHRKRKSFDKARMLYDKSLRTALELETGDLVALINTQLGLLARDTGQWHQAWDYFTKAKNWFERRTEKSPRDEPLARGIWGHLALVSLRLGRPKEAKELCLKSLEFFETQGTKGYLANLKYWLALIEDALGETEVASLHAQEATDWFDRLGMKPDFEKSQQLLVRLQLEKSQSIRNY